MGDTDAGTRSGQDEATQDEEGPRSREGCIWLVETVRSLGILAVEAGDCGFAIGLCGNSDPPAVVTWLSLAPPPPCVLRLYAGSVSLGYEVAMSLRLAEDTTHLDHSLESPQQRVLGFAFTYLNF